MGGCQGIHGADVRFEFCRLCCQANGLPAVTNALIGAGGQYPGLVVISIDKKGIDFKGAGKVV